MIDHQSAHRVKDATTLEYEIQDLRRRLDTLEGIVASALEKVPAQDVIDYGAPTDAAIAHRETHEPDPQTVWAVATLLHADTGVRTAIVWTLCRQFPGLDLIAQAKHCIVFCDKRGISPEHYLTVFNLWVGAAEATRLNREAMP